MVLAVYKIPADFAAGLPVLVAGGSLLFFFVFYIYNSLTCEASFFCPRFAFRMACTGRPRKRAGQYCI